MKIEIGGGRRAKGEGYLNVDQIPEADIVCNLDETPWPIETDSTTAVYSSHCMEHLKNPTSALKEIARICVVGSPVKIWVPHPMSESAMIPGHMHVISETFLVNALHHFPDDDWKRIGKALKLMSVEKHGDPLWLPLAKATPMYRRWNDEDIMDWVPRACFENGFLLTVVAFP